MDNNVKKLLLITIAILSAGFYLIWDGLEMLETKVVPTPTSQVHSIETPSPVVATASSVLGLEGQKVLVKKVVDGDTLQIEGATVRFIGIDTPETVDPRRSVGCFGKEASNETKRLLAGKEVVLQKDISDTDKYNRLLRYVYLPLEDGKYLFVNDYLVREGFAKASTYPPDVKYTEQFKEAEAEAREQKRGLWGKC
jgi:micrococcal nuclease